MHAIKPLHTLKRAEVRELAIAAADRFEPLHVANPFAGDCEQHDWFIAEYRDRQHQLSPA